MLAISPDPMRTAINRVTFGARQPDIVHANGAGLAGWMEAQFAAPPGDDEGMAAFLRTQTMRITYAAPDANSPRGTWTAVNEERPLNYLNAEIPLLFAIATQAGSTFAPAERTRIRQELLAASWIRNVHSRYQLREFMTDFWHNHFNIGKVENEIATALLPVYDRVSIRPHVFGNFRQMLKANATAPAMLLYLDNATSTAQSPNENYAREVMELHTMGGGAYLGVNPPPASYSIGADGVRSGFTDGDIIQASRVLSGWTVQLGQSTGGHSRAPITGEFFYNAAQHNTQATSVLNVNMSSLAAPMEQGEKLLDILAYHPATASFVVYKLCVRIFGENPPPAAVDRGVAAWNANKTAPDQIRKVLEAIVLGGPEITTSPRKKIRRPYERLIALARTTDMVVNASAQLARLLDSLNDGLFAWQAPDGRPDVNAYWLATGAMLTSWNLLLSFPQMTTNTTTLVNQTPLDVMSSATGVVEYWLGRMLGYAPSGATLTALTIDQASARGVPAAARTGNAIATEAACRRLVSLIAATEEFSYR